MALEPYPDAMLAELPAAPPGPEARCPMPQSIELGLIAALQHLPPPQRAVFVLRDVAGFETAEVARMLQLSEPWVAGVLRDARVVIQARMPVADRDRAPEPASMGERLLVRAFADAFERRDAETILCLLTADARLSTPPGPFDLRGRKAIAAVLRNRGVCPDGPSVRLIHTRANTQPAFGCYLEKAGATVAEAHAILVLTLAGDRIRAITRFSDNSLFAYFGLARTLPASMG